MAFVAGYLRYVPVRRALLKISTVGGAARCAASTLRSSALPGHRLGQSRIAAIGRLRRTLSTPVAAESTGGQEATGDGTAGPEIDEEAKWAMFDELLDSDEFGKQFEADDAENWAESDHEEDSGRRRKTSKKKTILQMRPGTRKGPVQLSLETIPDRVSILEEQNQTDGFNCSGCGVELQSEVDMSPGFVPDKVLVRLQEKRLDTVEVEEVEEEAEKRVVCQRCHQLRNNKDIDPQLRVRIDSTKGGQGPSELTPAKFRSYLGHLAKTRSVVIYLVDVFDFHGSFLKDVITLVGKRNPIILALNKVDLLPSDFKEDRVAKWIKSECAKMGMSKMTSIHLISSAKGSGVRELIGDAMAIARQERADIYVIGAANVGKSTFINNVIKQSRTKSRTEKRELLTSSVVPGTTLGLVKIGLGNGRILYDTPGIILPHQLTNSLSMDELKSVVPQKRVEYVSHRLGEGKSLFLGGLARIDVLEGKPFFFTTFVNGQIKVHPGRTSDADEFTRKHVGELLTPPYSVDRLDELGEWESKVLQAEGVGWRKAAVDVVLSGIGWVSLTGVGPVRIRVTAPKVVGLFARDALMPYEISKGVSRYTGARSVNGRAVQQKRRRR